MNNITLFTNILPEERERMMICFQASNASFLADECIMHYSSSITKIGILASGSAQLVALNSDGEENVLEIFHKDDVFGELFALPIDAYGYYVEALTPCQVVFIGYEHLIKRCENACFHHSQLVNNLFHMSAETSKRQGLHLHILSQRTIRKKLLVYLTYQQSLQGKDSFTIPMNLSTLSAYLCVDRAAMMREISKLNKENVLSSTGNHFQFL